MQLYNSWAEVETIPGRIAYAASLVAGFTVRADTNETFDVAVPAQKLVLGFPSSRRSADTGYNSPAAVLTVVEGLARCGVRVGGVMTWSIEGDASQGFAFARAMVAGLQAAVDAPYDPLEDHSVCEAPPPG